MIIRKGKGRPVSFDNVRRIISTVSEQYDGNIMIHSDARALNGDYGFTGRIVASSGQEGSRRSWSGRRGPWACWHAYRDVMLGVLTEYPDAVITTSMARYEGIAGFLSEYPKTADRNIGSMAQPAYMPDLCDCE